MPAAPHAVAPPARAALAAALTLALLVVAPVPAPAAAALAAPDPTVAASSGYWLVSAGGDAHAFGDAAVFGPNRNLGLDIVGMDRTAAGDGYWMVDTDGDVFAYGAAPDLGSRLYNADDVVDFAAHPAGAGYWMVATDGGVFSFGDAGFFGSTGAMRLNQPIVGMAATPSGGGYWLMASDGGIFAFGDAGFFGSTGAMTLNRPIVGMAATGTGAGYWLVASDGGIFSFGDAGFFGSIAGGGGPPVVGMVATPPDRRPVAASDALTVAEDTSGTVAVLDNDAGLGDGPLSVGVVAGPAHGAAAAAGGVITYAPAPDYAGPDSLTYRVTDADGDTDTATVAVTVTPVNDDPATPAMAVATGEGVPVTGTVIATDPDGDTLVFTLAGPPGHGTATVAASGAFTYTPDAGYSGPDGFVVGVDDGHGGTATATVTVTVSVGPVDHVPVAVADTATTPEETAAAVDVLANDHGLLDGGVVVAVAAGTLDPATEGTATVAGGTITFVPAADVNGAVTFDYTLADADGDTATAPVTIEVIAVNDAPTVSAIDPVSVPWGTRESDPLAFSVADVDDPAGSLTVTATSSNPALVPDANLSLTHQGGGEWTLVVDPLHHVEGTTTVTVTVSDGTASTDTAFVFEVTPR